MVIGKLHRDSKNALAWLLEDIWLYENGDAEIQVEGILETSPKEIVDSIRVFLPFEVNDVEDLSHLCGEASFALGYPRCWPDIYSEYKILSTEPRRVEVNGIDASVGDVNTKIMYSSGSSEIQLSFVPQVKGDKRLFRVAMLVKGLAKAKSSVFPRALKTMELHTYGIAPFGGGQIMTLLEERQLRKKDICPVKRHIVQVNFWETVEIVGSSIPAQSQYPMGTCHAPARFCPPAERQAKRLGTTVDHLKSMSNYRMMWKEEGVDGSGGTAIRVVFSQSPVQKWLQQHWLPLIGIGLSILSLSLALRKFLSG